MKLKAKTVPFCSVFILILCKKSEKKLYRMTPIVGLLNFMTNWIESFESHFWASKCGIFRAQQAQNKETNKALASACGISWSLGSEVFCQLLLKYLQ